MISVMDMHLICIDGNKKSKQIFCFVLKYLFLGSFKIIKCIIEKYLFPLAHYIMSDQSSMKTTVKKLEALGGKEFRQRVYFSTISAGWAFHGCRCSINEGHLSLILSMIYMVYLCPDNQLQQFGCNVLSSLHFSLYAHTI